MTVTNPTFILQVKELVRKDHERGRPTEVYQLARHLHNFHPELCPIQIKTLIEVEVVSVRGSAVWDKSLPGSFGE